MATTAAPAATYSCRHCGHRHPRPAPTGITGPAMVLCVCRTGRPHLACPVELADAAQRYDGLCAALAAALPAALEQRNCTCGHPDSAHCDGCLACPGGAHDECCGW